MWSGSSTLNNCLTTCLERCLQAQTDLYTILEGHAGQNWWRCPSICRLLIFLLPRPVSVAAVAEEEEVDLEAPLLPPPPPPPPPPTQPADTGPLLSPPLRSVPLPLRPSSPLLYPPLVRPLRPSARRTWTWLDWARFLAVKHALDALLVGREGALAVGCEQGVQGGLRGVAGVMGEHGGVRGVAQSHTHAHCSTLCAVPVIDLITP